MDFQEDRQDLVHPEMQGYHPAEHELLYMRFEEVRHKINALYEIYKDLTSVEEPKKIKEASDA